MTKPGIALQLFTVRDECARDYVGTLRALAAMGYPAVQAAMGYGGLTAPALRSLLGDLGLTMAGSHVILERLEANLQEEIDFNLGIANHDILCPWLAPDRRTDETYRRLPDVLNRVGQTCRDHGIRFSYHNHEFEFERVDGEYAMDYMLKRTDPNLVAFEPDVYWLKVAGVDAAPYIRQYSGRCPIIHLKDMTAGPNPTYAEVGAGIIDFGPIFAASEAGGAEWYVVEQDTCQRPPMESVKISLDNLRKMGKL